MREYKLSPSIYGADLGDLRGANRQLEAAKVELLHVDVMDGHFVYNMGFGVDHVRQIKNMTSIPLDVHLMIERPERLVEDFCKAGADMITVHAESTTRLLSCLEKIKANGKKAGIVLCPATHESILQYCLDSTDMVLQMMYNPGEVSLFHDNLLEKLTSIRKMFGDRDIDLEVDGGITDKNIKKVKDAGANVFVSGGFVFKGDVAENIQKLRDELAK